MIFITGEGAVTHHVFVQNYLKTAQIKHAQSTELAENVRKTVLESKIDSVRMKIESDKVKKNLENFRQIMILRGFSLVLTHSRGAHLSLESQKSLKTNRSL